MSIEIKRLTLGVAATNCYIVGDTDAGQAIVIDPVDNATLIHNTAMDAGWEIVLILATHGHYDHILASEALVQLTNAPFYIHKNAPQVGDTDSQPEMVRQLFPPVATPARLLADHNEMIETESIRLETLYTPGHAPGHICYYLRESDLLFGGDCLFAGSIGRTDLPYADHATLMNSIFKKIIPLGDDTQVLPGHMEPTIIGRERQTNPFLTIFDNR